MLVKDIPYMKGHLCSGDNMQECLDRMERECPEAFEQHKHKISRDYLGEIDDMVYFIPIELVEISMQKFDERVRNARKNRTPSPVHESSGEQ